MNRQRGDYSCQVRCPDHCQIDSAVKHGNHHGKRQDADFGQLKGHRSQIVRRKKTFWVQQQHHEQNDQKNRRESNQVAVVIKEAAHSLLGC